MVARSVSGEVVVYPIVQTHQENAVCRWVKVPIDLPSALEQEIGAIARTIVDSLQVVGIFGIELFETQDGRVLVNEIAPRTHNSGHYSLDACVTIACSFRTDVGEFVINLSGCCDGEFTRF